MARKKLTHRHRSLLILLSGIMAAVALVGAAVILLQKDDPPYYFVDSKYKNISSKIITNNTPSIHSTVEYPVTKNKLVNDQIEAAIGKYTNDFSEATRTMPLDATDPYTQSISYQITRNTGRYVSIVITIAQDMRGAHPVSANLFWTFDLEKGKAVTLSDLVGGSNDGLSRIILYTRANTKTFIQKHKGYADSEFINESITNEKTQNFIVVGRKYIEFPFGKGVVAPESDGDVSVRLSTDNLQLFLQNDVARALLEVSPIESVSVPKPKPETNESQVKPSSQSCNKEIPCIALTYDDGPGPYTEDLLKILAKHKAKATFFMVGRNAAKFPNIVKDVDKDGHTIGNHSWDHKSYTWLDEAKVRNELTETNAALQKITGKTPRYARPPYGAIDRKTYTVMKELNMSAIFWSIDTRDWADRDANIVCNRAVAGARPGAIIIMHDVHPTTVKAAECILSKLEKQSYKFVTVDTLFDQTTRPGRGYYKVD